MHRMIDDKLADAELARDALETERRLAALEAGDPRQERPKKVPCVWDHVDFMEWDTWQDLGLSPPAGEERFGNRLRKDETGRRRR